jgi:hypothetical protein
MKTNRPNSTEREERRRSLLILCALSVVCFSYTATAPSGIATAQSGRRPARSEPSPTTATVNEKSETDKPTTAKPPATSIVVGGDRLSATTNLPSGYLDIAIDSCVQRLRKAASLDVNSGGGKMSRRDAIEQAKKQKEGYIVWLEMKIEDDRNSVVIGYAVFSPQTAKVKTFGEVFLDGTRTTGGPVGVSIPTARRHLPLEYRMRDGGREVADRIMEEFHIAVRD